MDERNYKLYRNKFIQQLHKNRNNDAYWTNPSDLCREIEIPIDGRIWHYLLDQGLLSVSHGDNVRITEKGNLYVEHPIIYFFAHSEKIKFFWGGIVAVGAILSIIETIIQVVAHR